MYKKIISGIMLTLLLTGIFSLAINIRPIKSTWTGTVYIRADGSIDPPDAPIITHDNVTYTLTDNITSSGDGIVVERDNIIIDGAGYTLQGTGAYTGIDLAGRTNVTIKNITITAFACGIGLYYSSNNTVSGNTITANNRIGIVLDFSSNNSIVGNNIVNNMFGMRLSYSSNNSIVGNTFIKDGLVALSSSHHNAVENNTVNGKPLVYLEGMVDHRVEDAGQVILVNCTGIWVKDLNLSSTDIGVQLWETSNSVISGNNVTNNRIGIGLELSSNNSIVGNNIVNNLDGIWLGSGSSNNSIFRNNIANNMFGIRLFYSSNNGIFHNNFIDNTEQVYSSASTNVWDNGYPSGGNYWSDYSGTDLFSGPYQNETGSDGIGDTPYVIDENNIDHYPLMNPNTTTPPAPLVTNATIDINPKALNLRSRGKWITAYIELPEGYNVSDVDVSSIVLNGTVPMDLSVPMAVGDYDNDSVLDLMVCFNRTDIINYILAQAISFGNVTLTINGNLYSGTPFMGSCIIAVSDLAGDVNCDGVVDIYDISGACISYNSKEGESNWNPNANYAPPYNKIDIFDLVTIAYHYGETYP